MSNIHGSLPPVTLQQMEAAALAGDHTAAVTRLSRCTSGPERLIWARLKMDAELAQLRKMRKTEVQLWIPKADSGCALCRARHMEVVSSSTPASEILNEACPVLPVRLCSLMVSGHIKKGAGA